MIENKTESNGIKRRKANSVIHKDMKMDYYYFSKHLTITNIYQSLCNEFRLLKYITNNWLLSNQHNNQNAFKYIQHSIDGCIPRTLKVNAQRVIREDGKIYIACEGPNYGTVYDFWTLVWQENVKTIISLNFPYEECLYPDSYQKKYETIQYWPIVNGKTYNYMPFKITCINSFMMADCKHYATNTKECVYRLTQLCIQNCKQKNDRYLTHICYYRWPDGRLPLPWGRENTLAKAANTLLKLFLMVSNDKTLIHCHAGRGRTGVLLALDFAMHQLRNLQTVNIKAIIEKIRQQRPGAVINHWQYIYINLIIAEQVN
ncbi:Protein-tyrosine phosphatase family protein [Brugia pahangi]